jgi:D-sedoheptulose 7-phosphate isomerase
MKEPLPDKFVSTLIQDRIRRSIAAKEMLLKDQILQDAVALVGARLVESFRSGGKALFFGNGGSAADAQHFAAEFTGRFLKERPPLPALALSVNSSSVTAIGNDYGFDLVFARQLEALGKQGDVAVGISTSGNSPNVLRAFEAAKSKSMYTVALTGAGGKVHDLVDCSISVQAKETPLIQECHVLIGHILCEIVERSLFGSDDLETGL